MSHLTSLLRDSKSIKRELGYIYFRDGWQMAKAILRFDGRTRPTLLKKLRAMMLKSRQNEKVKENYYIRCHKKCVEKKMMMEKELYHKTTLLIFSRQILTCVHSL